MSSLRKPWEPPRSESPSEWRVATTQDIEHALGAAERMLRSSEEVMRHQQNTQVAVYSFAVIGAISVATIVVDLFGTSSHGFLIAAPVAGVCAVVAIAISLRLLVVTRKSKSVFDPELQNVMAHEIATAVENVYIEVAYRDKWSQLRLSSTKARLSAFALHERRNLFLRAVRRDDRSGK